MPASQNSPTGSQGVLFLHNEMQGDALLVVASPPSGNSPGGGAGGLPIYSCSCSASQPLQQVYFANDRAATVQQNTINQLLLRCQLENDKDFMGRPLPAGSPCICDESGECFTPFGTLAGTGIEKNLDNFIIAPYCDPISGRKQEQIYLHPSALNTQLQSAMSMWVSSASPSETPTPA